MVACAFVFVFVRSPEAAAPLVREPATVALLRAPAATSGRGKTVACASQQRSIIPLLDHLSEGEGSSAEHGAAGNSAQLLERIRAAVLVDPATAQARWSAEAEDPAWTEQTRADLSSALTDLEVSGGLDSISCRTTLCRVSMKFGTPEEAFKLAAGVGDPARQLALGVVGPEGSLAVDLMLAR
jgi:hypothetical protein